MGERNGLLLLAKGFKYIFIYGLLIKIKFWLLYKYSINNI